MAYGYAPAGKDPAEDRLPIYWGHNANAMFTPGDEVNFSFSVTDDPVGRYVFGCPDAEYLWLCIPQAYTYNREYFEVGAFGFTMIPFSVSLTVDGVVYPYLCYRTTHLQSTDFIEIEVLPA